MFQLIVQFFDAPTSQRSFRTHSRCAMYLEAGDTFRWVVTAMCLLCCAPNCTRRRYYASTLFVDDEVEIALERADKQMADNGKRGPRIFSLFYKQSSNRAVRIDCHPASNDSQLIPAQVIVHSLQRLCATDTCLKQ